MADDQVNYPELRLLHFDFTPSTHGLAAGVKFGSVRAGDVVAGYILSVGQAFDGTTPQANLYLGDSAEVLFGAPADISVTNTSSSNPLEQNPAYQSLSTPYVVTGDADLKLVANQTGILGGTALDSSHGKASLYVLIFCW